MTVDPGVDDALARLRAYAYSNDTTLDQVADELVDGVRIVQDLD